MENPVVQEEEDESQKMLRMRKNPLLEIYSSEEAYFRSLSEMIQVREEELTKIINF